ncbi:cell division protein ZipA [Shewanella gaetbuli]
MDDLQLVLLVLGAIAIIAVLVHGFWSIRKQQPKSMKDSPMANFYKEQADNRDAEGFDNDGIGPVRVRKADEVDPPVIKPTLKTAHAVASKNQQATAPQTTVYEETVLKAATDESAIQAAKITDVEPTFNTDDEQQPSFSAAGPAHNETTQTAQQQSLFADDEPTNEPLNFDAPAEQVSQVEDMKVEAEQPTEKQEPLADPTDVLVLHVVAKEGELLQGAELLPALLGLNFKFGDMDIFHRHIDNAGTGNVLFSLANMVKPGIFDPDNMEQFVTEGVVLFMTLPCYGDPKMNFTIMLNSALQLADDLGAELLDGSRRPWDDNAKQDYKCRIEAA